MTKATGTSFSISWDWATTATSADPGHLPAGVLHLAGRHVLPTHLEHVGVAVAVEVVAALGQADHVTGLEPAVRR